MSDSSIVGRPLDVDADAAVRCVARDERLAGERHVPGDPLADLRLEHVESPIRLRIGRRGTRSDGDPRPRGRRRGSCGSRSGGGARRRSSTPISATSFRRLSFDETPCSIFRWAIERNSAGRFARLSSGRSAAVVLEDDDLALAARLRRHHRDLRAGDELTGVRSVIGARGDADRDAHRARPGRTPCARPAPGRARRVRTHRRARSPGR